ncbi:Cwf15/Cwc15 cell cycle control protein, partial [Toxoplasma gondii TgCatPRC2]
VSAKDQPGNLTLKTRKAAQGPQTSDRSEFRVQLEAKEKKALADRKKAEATLTALPPDYENPFPEDADDVDAPGPPSEASSDEDDDSDEEEALLRELEKIKKERMQEEQAKQAEEEKKRQAEQQERMLRANPLLMADGAVKRRWDDEVVFRNQAKNQPKAKRQFVNDPVRSEFHKKFLSKYIR